MNLKEFPIGIDLGTTNSCIGVFRNGRVEIIPNQITGRTTPSFVSFCGDKISVGEQTENTSFKDPEKVIYSVKRFIGKKYTEPNFNKYINQLAYKNKIINFKGRPKIQINFNGKNEEYFPEEISAMVLKRLKENAKIFLNQEIKKVVITIPAYFTEAQREATKLAGEGVGLEVIKIINEPTAAALAYGLKNKNDLIKENEDDLFTLFKETDKQNKSNQDIEDFEEKTILVFDLGGGTLDVTCLKIIKDEDGTQFEILGHSGNTLLGGDDFDNILVDYCIDSFKKEYKIDINTRNIDDIKAKKRLKIACERAKKILSYQNETKINLDSLYKNKDFQIEITRAKFENLFKLLFDNMTKPIDEALKCSKLEKKILKKLYL